MFISILFYIFAQNNKQMELRDYQKKAKADISTFLNSNKKKGIVVMPVATGKALITAIIAELVSEPILVIQPSKELTEQNLEKAYAFGIYPSVYSASLGRKEVSNIVYATPQSVVKNASVFKHIQIVVIDEAHLQLTNKKDKNGRIYGKGSLGKFLDTIKPRKIIGLTATPVKLVSTRLQGAYLHMMNRTPESYWNNTEIIHVTQIKDICNTYWSNVLIQNIEPEVNRLEINASGSEFTDKSMSIHFKENNILSKIAKVYWECVEQGRKSFLTFVPSLDEANLLKELLGDSTEIVGADTPKKERDRIIRDFKRNNIRHIISVTALATGFDHPGLDTLIMARETSSFALYLQMFGRVVRPSIVNGKVVRTRDILLDFTGNTKRFGDIRDATFEKHSYINGWGMFIGNKLHTGFPVKLEKPTKEELIKDYEKKSTMIESILDEDSRELEFFKRQKMLFGKHKGEYIYELVDKNSSYIEWVDNNCNLSRPEYTGMRTAIKYFMKRKALGKC